MLRAQIVGETLTIARRFCGPDDSGNGGYSTGVVGVRIGPSAEVTLRLPPPLDTPMEVVRGDGGRVELKLGDQLVAEGQPRALEVEVPEAVDFDRAEHATHRFVWRDQHPFPRCFVCGIARAPGDGLRIFPGPVGGDREVVAAPWRPDPSLADDTGMHVQPEHVWSVLDCPSWFGIYAFRTAELTGGVLLGRLSAHVEARPRIGERCVVIGWPIKIDGRKVFGASALFGEDGRRYGSALATWIRTVR